MVFFVSKKEKSCLVRYTEFSLYLFVLDVPLLSQEQIQPDIELSKLVEFDHGEF